MANGVLALDPWWVLEQAETFFNTYVERLRNNDAAVVGDFNAFMAIRKAR
jgi:hypothetical protein